MMSATAPPALDSGHGSGDLTEQHRAEQSDAAVAMVFAALMAQPPPPVPRPLPTALGSDLPSMDHAPSVDWRTTASTMTESSSGVVGQDTSIIAHADSAELGRLSVAVDRADGSIRVRVLVGREEILGAMQARQHLLLEQLRAVGLVVTSLELGRQPAPGTRFAADDPPSMTRNSDSETDEEPSNGGPPLGTTRAARRRSVNLKG